MRTVTQKANLRKISKNFGHYLANDGFGGKVSYMRWIGQVITVQVSSTRFSRLTCTSTTAVTVGYVIGMPNGKSDQCCRPRSVIMALCHVCKLRG